MSGSVCVIDVGTSSVRAAMVDDGARIVDVARRPLLPSSPAPGLVEFDPVAMANAAVDAATEVLSRHGAGVRAVGVSNQRASTVCWDRATGRVLAPGIGWQDLRTVGECLEVKARTGLGFAPNQTATKAAWLLAHGDVAGRRICVGTVDSWIVWRLSGGDRFVTDASNAMVTGLARIDAGRVDWDDDVLAVMGIARDMLPEIVASVGQCAQGSALPGAPPVTGILGDQQASLLGQGCVRPGATKITFGTGAMADLYVGTEPPASQRRGPHGTFPIVAFDDGSALHYGVEAIMLAAGTNVEWLVEDLGLVPDAASTDALAASVPDSGGVVYVPALLGLGTPHWDYGARGTLLGLTRGSGSAHVVRAVLDGIAHRGADLVEAAEADTGLAVEKITVDGGMSRNSTFVQCLADATGRPVAVSRTTEATTLGAAAAAGVAVGIWPGIDAVAEVMVPSHTVEPTRDASGSRARWNDAVGRASRWIPELSTLDF